nr:MAG TPA: hypothetical protein [Caudoviricetes sp.]
MVLDRNIYKRAGLYSLVLFTLRIIKENNR